MSKWRLKFSKLGMGKYISHLDLLRTFTRSIHRAEIPVRYSQGFNPHQLITFSLPLALGVTSETEFVDIDFEDTVSPDEILTRLNKNLPPDIKILKVSQPIFKAHDIVSAKYIIDIIAPRVILKEKIESFFEQENISATKKTKKGEKEINLRDFIKEVKVVSLEGNAFRLDALLSAGGEANIKPDIVVAKLQEYLNSSEFESVDIHRVEIFFENDKKIESFC
ncbi:MAG: DUF2344 domain-containing protein [Clostridia bacterium]|nr:DUF2344 domain-containing protein [Clostridia bacterium]